MRILDPDGLTGTCSSLPDVANVENKKTIQDHRPVGLSSVPISI